jgi:hypothetical protein
MSIKRRYIIMKLKIKPIEYGSALWLFGGWWWGGSPFEEFAWGDAVKVADSRDNRSTW